MMQALPPCLVKNCKNQGWCAIFIEKKGLPKTYTICRKHVNWLKKTGEVIIKDY